MNNEYNEKMKKMISKGRIFRKFQSFELRALDNLNEDGSSKEMIIEGIACVFEKETTLFENNGIEYKEIVDKDAFKDADIADVIFNYNHGGRVYARTRNNTMIVSTEADGIHVKIKLNPNDNGHQEIYRDIKSGLIDKMSYAYTVADSNYDSDTHTERVLKIKKLYDVSAVDFPAYEETSINARSIIELDNSIKEKVDTDIKQKKLLQRKKVALAMNIQLNLNKIKK